jgi:hypothetical protein
MENWKNCVRKLFRPVLSSETVHERKLNAKLKADALHPHSIDSSEAAPHHKSTLTVHSLGVRVTSLPPFGGGAGSETSSASSKLQLLRIDLTRGFGCSPSFSRHSTLPPSPTRPQGKKGTPHTSANTPCSQRGEHRGELVRCVAVWANTPCVMGFVS